jgi:hypothetical protein
LGFNDRAHYQRKREIMRHNQNGRRFRGNGRSGHGGSQGGNHGGNHGGQRSSDGNRRINPRVQTFDSNGPEVRIRGNAIQINEKYLTLAKDALSVGDRVLAESYLQHAEHYQRMLNEAAEEASRYQQQHPQHQPQPQQQQQQGHHQPSADGNNAFIHEDEQPSADGLADLDQGFLVGPARTAATEQPAAAEGEQPQAATGRRGQGRRPQYQQKDVESA